MKQILALWLAAMLVAVQPCYAVVMVGFGQSAEPPAGISDDFSSDTSANYTAVVGGISVGSGVATGTSDYSENILIHETEVGTANQTVYADIEVKTSKGSGIVCRASSASGSATGYIVVMHNTGNAQLQSFSGSTVTGIDYYALTQTITEGQLYPAKITCNGTSITLYLNFGSGYVSQGSITSSTYSSGNYAGLSFSRVSGYSGRADNFSAEQL